MAASKLHLKNVNKDYKLEATDKRTNEGRIVYKNTKTGELHSELSMTLEMPEGSGNWINVPSLINGRVYNVQGVIDMLKAGKITPNSTGHATQDAAVEAAIYRSNNLQDDDGVSLRPNNELTLSKDSIMHPDNADKNQGYSQAELDQINQDYRTEQSEAQTKRLTKIMNNQDLEKNDEFYKMKGNVNNDQFYNIGDGNPWGSSIFGNYKGLPTQYLQPYGEEKRAANIARGEAERAAIAQAKIDSKYSRDEALTDPQIPFKQITAADDYDPVKAAFVDENMRNININAGSTNNGVIDIDQALNQQILGTDDASIQETVTRNNKIKELAAIMDRANAEKDDTNNNIDLLKRYKLNNGTVSAADQAIFDKAKSIRFPGNEDANFDSNTVYDMGVSDDGIFPGFPKYNAGPLRRSSKGISSKDNESFDIPILGNDVVTDGSKKSTTKKTSKKIGSYYDDMPPAEKMKDNRSLKNATLSEYGDMPGFKLPPKDAKGNSTGNYWSVDETSPFWQTDAGYEKAMQVWGEKPGWVKPGYRPKKKELDINAIKKWFTPSK